MYSETDRSQPQRNVKVIPQERVSERIVLTRTRRLRVYRKCEFRSASSMKRSLGNHDQVKEETVEVVLIMPQKRVQNRTVDHIVDVPVPHTQERRSSLSRTNGFPNRTVEQNREVVLNTPMERTWKESLNRSSTCKQHKVREKTKDIPKVTQQVENTQYQLQTVSRQEPANH